MYSLPVLQRDDIVFRVKNCDLPRDENSDSVCPELFCKKALLESGEVPWSASINVVGERKLSQTDKHIIGGIIKFKTKDNPENVMHFQCWMNRYEVEKYEILKGRE